jgi:Tol biopolymer transport system component/DNA-binding winged helix-turn-helix (wHTH) protein
MAAPASQPTGSYRFGPFELDPVSGDLRKSGLRVALQDQPLAILLALLASPGRLVTRDELRHRLWREDTFVDFEHGLNAAIKRLRDTLGDSADSPHLIETVPRRGYRFIGALQGFPVGVVAVAPQTPGSGAPAETGGGDAVAVPPGARDSSSSETASAVASASTVVSSLSWRPRWFLAAGGALVLIAAAAGLAYLFRPLPPPRITRTTGVARGAGVAWGRLVTDGVRLYFTAVADDRLSVWQVAATGGEPSRIPTPGIAVPVVVDVSPDGSELLLRSGFFTAELWILPLPAGGPRRLADLAGQDAAWSPDGRKLAYAHRTDVYVASNDGSGSTKLLTLPNMAYALRWSPDGTRLRFTATLDADDHLGLVREWWEVGADGSGLRRILPGWPVRVNVMHLEAGRSAGGWTRDGRYFTLISDRGGDGNGSVWAVREATGRLRQSGGQPVRLSTDPVDYTGVTPSADGRRLFALGQQRRGELVRIDAASGEPRLFLSGISAEMLDFSRDGQWVAFVSFPDGALWRCRTNGDDRRQLTSGSMAILTPRWSPDGRRIAFAATRRGERFHVYIVPANGGALEDPMPQDTLQGDPSWSPDGRALAFHSLQPTPPAYNVQVLDLQSREVRLLPGSEALFSPRWSPDGRHILALARRKDHRGLMLFDVETQRWTSLWSDGAADWPHWSPDGTRVYFRGTPGGKSDEVGVYRIHVRRRTLERVLGAAKFAGEGIAGVPWWGLAPDGSVLTLRSTSFWGIYAFDWEAP